MSAHWGVFGGGMLGLTLAHRLAREGQRVTLCEAASELGGLASAWRLGDVVWDRHYHVILLSDLRLRSLLGELGLDRETRWVQTRTGFYTSGRLHSLSSTYEFLTFPPLTVFERFRLGLTILIASRIRDWRRLESMPVEEWLSRWSGQNVFAKIWRPLLEAKLGANYRKTNAAFIWASIRRMYAARRTGLKREMFGYVQGGYARILARMAEVLSAEGVEICTHCRVEQVVPREDGSLAVSMQGGRTMAFDKVVFTTPASVIAGACPGLTADERRRFEKIEYQGIVCASFLSRKPLSGFYITNITDEGMPFTAVIEMTALVDRKELGGHHLVYLPKYCEPDDPLFQKSDDEVRDTFLSALERMHPSFSRNDVSVFRISRVRQVMALPTLYYSSHLPPMATSVPNLFVVNSAHIVKGVLAVDETIQVVDEALQTVLRS